MDLRELNLNEIGRASGGTQPEQKTPLSGITTRKAVNDERCINCRGTIKGAAYWINNNGPYCKTCAYKLLNPAP